MVGLIWVNLFAVLKKKTKGLFYGSVGTRCQQKKQYAYIVNTDLLVQLTMRVKQRLNLLNTVKFVLCLLHNNDIV